MDVTLKHILLEKLHIPRLTRALKTFFRKRLRDNLIFSLKAYSNAIQPKEAGKEVKEDQTETQFCYSNVKYVIIFSPQLKILLFCKCHYNITRKLSD